MEQQIALVLMILLIVLLCATPVLSTDAPMANSLLVDDDTTIGNPGVSEIRG